MAAYIISEVRSLDAALMEQYRQLASESIAAYGGTYLVRGAEIDALEGEASDGFRLVVVEFPSRADAQAWYQSPEYQAALQIRFRGALERRLVLVDGI